MPCSALFLGENWGLYQQRKDQSCSIVMCPNSETELRSLSQCVGLHLGGKNYKAKSNLFYFIVYGIIFQLGSWQADRVNLSWERFGASEPYIIYVHLYLPNVMVTYSSQWLCPLLKYHPLLAARGGDYFHFPLVVTQVC